MIKHWMVWVAILAIVTGCSNKSGGTSSEIRVLADKEVGTDRTVENTAEATYKDSEGRPPQEPVVSNKVVIPIEDECIPPKRPEPPIVTYPTEVTPKRVYAVVASKRLTEPAYITQVDIPKRPPKIVIQKYPDRDVLCCDQNLVFYIQFQNIGGQDAYNVEIIDEIPKNVDYLEASAGSMPYLTDIAEERGPNGKVSKITWKVLGPVPPGSMGKVYYTIICEQKRPSLDCNVTFTPLCLGVGDSTTIDIKVRNSGNGVAPKCKMQFSIPEGIEYEGDDKGKLVNIEVGDIGPGQTVDKQFTIKMVKPVDFQFVVTVSDEKGTSATCASPIPPRLLLTKDGPSSIRQKSSITYTINVKNQGGGKATNCELVDELPKNSQFVEASDNGEYRKEENVVVWKLGDLESQQGKTVTIKIVAILAFEKEGTEKLEDKAHVTCNEGCIARDDAVTVVEGIPAMHINQYDTDDPVEVGQNTTYVIEVRNEGLKPTTQVQLINNLDAGMEFIAAEGTNPANEPIKNSFRDGKVYFDPIPVMLPGDKAIYKVTVKFTVLKDYVNHAYLSFAEFDKPVRVEEPTKSYK